MDQNQVNVNNLVEELKEIQSLGMEKEFNILLKYLQVNNEEENIPKTNIISRRLNTFNIIRQNLISYFPPNEKEQLIQPGKLKDLTNKMINKSLLYTGLIKNYLEGQNQNFEFGIEELDGILKVEPNNKLRQSQKNKIVVEEDFYVPKNKNDLLPPQDDNKIIPDILNSNSKNNISDNKYISIAPEKESKTYQNEYLDDLEINLQIQNDHSNSGLVLSKSINYNNDLSDLDQEEYYMKNCYDFYNYDITSLKIKKIIDDTHPIRCCCFSPKGDYFAIGTNSKSVKIYDLNYILENFNKKSFYNKNDTSLNSSNQNKKRPKPQKEIIGMIFEQKNHHYGSIYCVDWSSSGKLLATGSNDKTIKLMNIPELDNSELIKDYETLELQITGIKGIVRSLCFEPTNDLVLLSANQGDNLVRLWDTEKGINVSNFEGHGGDVNVVKWSNDSQLCASSSLDKTIRFWDLRESKMINIISGIKYSDINDISIFTKHKGGNSTLIAAGHVDGIITIWDYAKRCVVKEICEHNEEVRAVSFSPDGKYLISGSFDSKIKIFDVNDNFRLLGELNHNDRVVSAKWHPEIPLIISTSADKTARVWIPEKC